jgi:hypothetical protein
LIPSSVAPELFSNLRSKFVLWAVNLARARARGKHCLTSSQHPSTFPLSEVLQSLPGGASLQKGVIIPIPVVAVVVVVLVYHLRC